jgi:NADH-quinone oxidoreductase subunit E
LTVHPQAITQIVAKHHNQRGALIAILEQVQSTYGYLTQEALRSVAELTATPLVDVYAVATFYKSFSLKPRGRHLCSVCVGTACHVRGSPVVGAEFERQLGVRAGETTADRQFTLEKVACLGACALGPIVVVDGHYFANVKARDTKRILDRAREGFDKVEIQTDATIFPVRVSCPRCNHSLMDPQHQVDGHPSIRMTISFERVHGWLRLSSLYGSYNIDCEFPIPTDTVANFFCPHCHAELSSGSQCAECGSPMVPMVVREGGIVQICSRRGCKFHMLDLDGANL